jgi:hypothetical protein
MFQSLRYALRMATTNPAFAARTTLLRPLEADPASGQPYSRRHAAGSM